MAVKDLPASTSFVVHYEDSIPNAQARAQAIASVCEHELTVLTGWFGITGGFGTGDRIHVYLDQADGSGAVNYGYQSGGRSNIHMDAQSANASATNAEAIVRMIFINELVEILMSYASGHGGPKWNAGDSSGEGLSQLLGIERFRTGHYLYYGSFVDGWLQTTTRTDWITAPEGTDKKSSSFGCALLFLYYLKSQLHFSVPDIIQKGGSDLEATYKALTGNAGGFAAFNGLVSASFPPGQTPALVDHDDPFPLLPPNQRGIDLNLTDADNGPAYKVAGGSATVSPYVLCPEKTYSFEIDSTPQTVRATATTRGFGQPLMTWRVNGVDVGGGGHLDVSAHVTTIDPVNPTSTSQSLQTVGLQCAPSSTTWTSTLRIDVPAAVVGLVDLTVEVDVHDRFVSPATVSNEYTWDTAHNERLVWEDQYYKDRTACRARWDDLMRRFTHYKHIDIVRTLPDPPPDYYRAIRQLEVMWEVLRDVAKEEPELMDAAERALSVTFGMDLDALGAVVHQVGRMAPGR